MSENSPENSRKFPMIYTVGLFVERFQPLACALFGTWLAHEYLKPNLDLFVPGIFMAFFGGVMFVIKSSAWRPLPSGRGGNAIFLPFLVFLVILLP